MQILTEPHRGANSYAPFPLGTLAEPLRSYVEATATAIGCDSSYVAVPAMACLARAIGDTRAIRLKRTWTEPAVIWGAIVGKSGTHKSPALAAATAELQRRQDAATEKYGDAMLAYETSRAEYDRAYAAWRRRSSDDPPPMEPREPVHLRCVCRDITIEALVDRLEGQYGGVLIVRDELAGWLDGIAEYKGGKGSDTGHWLACWSAAALTVDRKTGPKRHMHIPRAAVSIVGGVQPGVLRRALGKEHMQDGLCARLLLTMPPPRPVTWTEASIDPATEAAVAAVYTRLLDMEPAADSEGRACPYSIPLDSDAKRIWVDYYNRHRAEIPNLDDDLAAAWSKLEAYAARLALLHQLVRWAAGEAGSEAVDAVSMTAGIELSDWFGSEARRVYAVLAESEEAREQRELFEWIARRGGSVTARDIQRNLRRYAGPNEAEAALSGLQRSGYGRWNVDTHKGRKGAPATRFVLTGNRADINAISPRANGICVGVGAVDLKNPAADYGEV